MPLYHSNTMCVCGSARAGVFIIMALSLLMFFTIFRWNFGDKREIGRWSTYGERKAIHSSLDRRGNSNSSDFLRKINDNSRIDDKEEMSNTSAQLPSDKEILGSQTKENPFDYAVMYMYYHKTGWVLSHELRNLMKKSLEDVNIFAGNVPLRKKQIAKREKMLKETNAREEAQMPERLGFDYQGLGMKSAFPQRLHSHNRKCPSGWFNLERRNVYMQEAPDLFCNDTEISRMLSEINSSSSNTQTANATTRGGTKIIHFVRDPFDMVLSNYFYHAQVPSPEDWVHDDDPCDHRYKNGDSLGPGVVPALLSESIAMPTPIDQNIFDGIVSMCDSLYRSTHSLKNESFYSHLLELEPVDGLRLSTAQMMISSGGLKGLAGGDVMRMANNIIKMKRLQSHIASSSSDLPHFDKRWNFQLLTVSMEDFIADPAEFTTKIFDFVLGKDSDVIPMALKEKAARRQQALYRQKLRKKDKHMTRDGNENKEELREFLRQDALLGPVLNLTQILVREALLASEGMMH